MWKSIKSHSIPRRSTLLGLLSMGHFLCLVDQGTSWNMLTLTRRLMSTHIHLSCSLLLLHNASIYGFWLPLWNLVAIVLSVLLRFTDFDYPFGIFKKCSFLVIWRRKKNSESEALKQTLGPIKSHFLVKWAASSIVINERYGIFYNIVCNIIQFVDFCWKYSFRREATDPCIPSG
jgi:hypothetical protein